MAPDRLAEALLWFVAFLFSTTVHEAAHAWAARLGGDPTAYLGGQVSLSPLPHIRREPIGMVVAPLLTAMVNGWALGWATTPFDPLWADRHPRRAAWMAAAGPAGNFAVAFVALASIWGGVALEIFAQPPRMTPSHLVTAAAGVGAASLVGFAAQTLSVLLYLNVILGLFNLLPLPPMDGGAVLGLVLPSDAARSLRRVTANPMFSLLGLVAAWWFFPYLAGPILRLVVGLLAAAS